jgi:hypothetical protein
VNFLLQVAIVRTKINAKNTENETCRILGWKRNKNVPNGGIKINITGIET